jgi:hypothetical protein
MRAPALIAAISGVATVLVLGTAALAHWLKGRGTAPAA